MKFTSTFKKTITQLMLVTFFFCFGIISAQENESAKNKKEAIKYMQQAETSLGENNFPLAEANYRKAIAADTSFAEPLYNLGTLYFTKNKATEAAQRLAKAGKTGNSKVLKHNAYHNQGNALMRQKDYKGAVEAYKNSLRNDPTDDETRYNLALAKKMLEQQQKQNKSNPKKDDKKNDSEGKEKKKENEKKKEDQKKKQEDSGNKQQDKKEKPKDQQQQQENKNKNGDKKKENQPQQPKPVSGKLSPKQINNLLEAMKNQEQEVQKKINTQKSKGSKLKTEKDW